MTHNHRIYPPILGVGIPIVGLISGTGGFAANKNPCSEDIAKFCKDVKPGQGAIMDCQERHESQLSDACKDYEVKMGGTRVEAREGVRQRMRVRQACREDVAKFCKDVKPERGGIAICLNEHANELSIPCKDAMKAATGGEEEKKAK